MVQAAGGFEACGLRPLALDLVSPQALADMPGGGMTKTESDLKDYTNEYITSCYFIFHSNLPL